LRRWKPLTNTYDDVKLLYDSLNENDVAKAKTVMARLVVGLKGTCPHCGEEVELIVSKKQLKALLKGMKEPNIRRADMVVEKILGRDKKGNLRGGRQMSEEQCKACKKNPFLECIKRFTGECKEK